ncbi:hypothetical protein [Roseateles sp.]|uniref:hypothetical protein n=1 Tax=Roseateles sp. TaxID=1971397 RepID=UPI0025DD472E|nr:hypothetical protein [Roseateles sp.]MBV8034136.1 hypothetical protein [Roseateles sp.]
MADTDVSMVMRSVYLRPEMDAELRNLAFQLRVSKADLIRAFVAEGLKEMQRHLGANPDEQKIARIAATVGSAQLTPQEAERSEAAMERIRAAVGSGKRRSYVST